MTREEYSAESRRLRAAQAACELAMHQLMLAPRESRDASWLKQWCECLRQATCVVARGEYIAAAVQDGAG